MQGWAASLCAMLVPVPPTCQISARLSPPRDPPMDCPLSWPAPPPLPIMFFTPSFRFLQSSFHNCSVLYLRDYRLSLSPRRLRFPEGRDCVSCSQLCPCVKKDLVVFQTRPTSNNSGLNKKRAYFLLKKYRQSGLI